MNFYIADLHLGHANIIRLNNRPFHSVEQMDETLIKNWNNAVSDNDDVYILGDLMFKTNNPEKYLKRLNGKKHLIVGNHDQFIKNESLHKYFVSIEKYDEVYDNGQKVILFHYPIREWNGFFRNSIHLYGHIHNNANDTKYDMDKIDNCYNVGADVLGYTPRTLKEIIAMNKNGGNLNEARK